jgi:hypothetical protein
MNSLHNYYKTLDAGLETASQFSEQQVHATMKVVRDADISTPKLIRKGDNVSVSLRSKTKNVIVSVKGLVNPRSPRFLPFVETAIQLVKDDTLTLASNTRVERDDNPDLRASAQTMMDAWRDAVSCELGGTHPIGMDKRLIANACLCYSAAINLLIANLMMEAMEETDNEGLKLCFANRAKIFHEHAKSNEHVLEIISHGDVKIQMAVV